MDAATKWLEAGLEYFTLTGKVDLNKISERVGLSKSSFYNIYVSENGKKPLEMYREDILDELDIRLDKIITAGEETIYNTPIPESYRNGIRIINENYVVYRSLGKLATLYEDKRATEIYNKSQARLFPMIEHIIKQMYPEIPEIILETTSSGLVFAGTLFMLNEPDLNSFSKFATEVYENLYAASKEKK